MEIRQKSLDSHCWHVTCFGLIGMFGITGFERKILLQLHNIMKAPSCKKDEAIVTTLPPIYSYAPALRFNMPSHNGGIPARPTHLNFQPAAQK